MDWKQSIRRYESVFRQYKTPKNYLIAYLDNAEVRLAKTRSDICVDLVLKGGRVLRHQYYQKEMEKLFQPTGDERISVEISRGRSVIRLMRPLGDEEDLWCAKKGRRLHDYWVDHLRGTA
jgi:hypothetical protein